MTLSVIVPAYNAQRTLHQLLDSLIEQNFRDFEVIVVDDCSSDRTYEIARLYSIRLIKLENNKGPAFCRNIGALKAKGHILVFTDSDCHAGRDWLKNIHDHFIKDNLDALMGRLILDGSHYLGESISALGFPAGGSLGFDKMWKVDNKGVTESLSSCNCAIKREAFESVGGFDETFPFAGGEDSYLAYTLVGSGYRIKYCPDVIIYHKSRESLRNFFKWQFRRGISSYIFSRKIKNKTAFLSLRIWSTKNILRKNIYDTKLPLILFLLGTSVFLQILGFFSARYNQDQYESSNH